MDWPGGIFKDVLGREYIDCLGGYGMMDHGWSHPDVVAAVAAQLQRTPMPSQELIDPLRGVLARLMADITPGDIKYSFFCASGTEAIEGAIKLAKMYTKKAGFIVATKAFHGKTMGSLSMMGKSDYRVPLVFSTVDLFTMFPMAMPQRLNNNWRSVTRSGSVSPPF